MDDRRRLMRIPFETDVRIRAEGDPRTYVGTVINIHVEGVLLSSNTLFELGQWLSLEVAAPEGEGHEPLTGQVEVIRVEGDTAPFEIAAEFRSLNLP